MKKSLILIIKTGLLFILFSCNDSIDTDDKYFNKKFNVSDTIFQNYNFYSFYGKKASKLLDIINLDTLWTSGVKMGYDHENYLIKFRNGIMIALYVYSDSLYQVSDSIYHVSDSIRQNSYSNEFNFEELKDQNIYKIYIINQYYQRIFPTYIHQDPRDIVILMRIMDKIITSVFGQDHTIWNKYLNDYYIEVLGEFWFIDWIFQQNNYMVNFLSRYIFQ